MKSLSPKFLQYIIFAGPKGMPKFEGDLSREEISFIQHFVVRESRAIAE